MMAMVGQAAESMGRLLVVEGDLVQRTVIGRIGEKLGYDILIASCFEAAPRLLTLIGRWTSWSGCESRTSEPPSTISVPAIRRSHPGVASLQ
jgi:hypothetical protein